MVAAGPEIECLSIFDWVHFRGPEAYVEYHGGLSAGVAEPYPELLHVEDRLIHTNTVIQRIGKQLRYREFEVKKTIDYNVQSCEWSVVNLVDPFLVHGLTRENRVVAEHELYHDVEYVLVEHVQYYLTIASVVLTAVHEEELVKELELADREVGRLCSLHTLAASDADTDVCLTDHRAVVGSVADCQSDLILVTMAHQCNNVTLLLRRDTTTDNDLHLVCALEHELEQAFVQVDYIQAFSREDEGILCSVCHVLHIISHLDKLLANSLFLSAINQVLI